MRKSFSRFFASGIVFDLLILFVISLLPLLWFRPGQIIVGHDNVFPLDPSVFFRDRLFTWSEHHGFGYDQSLGMGSIVTHAIDVSPLLLGVGLQAMEKIVYCFWFFALVFSAYILVYFLEKWGFVSNRFLRLLLPVWYAVNFYVLEAWWIGERTKFSAMVNLPILLLLLIGIVHKKIAPLKAGILASILLTIFNAGGMKGIPLGGGIFVTLGVSYVYFSFIAIADREFSIIKRLAVFTISFLAFSVLFNAYMLLPFLSHTLGSYGAEISRIGGAENTLGWVNVISKDASIMNLLRFQGIPEWYTALDHPYSQLYLQQRKLILISFLFPFLLFLSFLLIRGKREKRIYFLFVLLFITSLIFSMGTHFPSGTFYTFMISHIPGFAIFRSPIYKFGYAYWFSGGFLIATAVSILIRNITSIFGHRSREAGLFLTCIVLVGYIFYHFPYLSGDIFRWSNDRLENRVAIPGYVYDAARWVDENRISSRILLLPEANSEWLGDVYKWKFYSLYPLLADLSRHSFVYNNDSVNDNEKSYLSSLYKAIRDGNEEQITTLCNKLNIDYFIVRDDFYNDLSWMPTISPQVYEKAFEASSSFRDAKRFGQWHIFELKKSNLTGSIYATTSISVVDKDIDSVLPYAEIDEYATSFAQRNGLSQGTFIDRGALSSDIPPDDLAMETIVSSCVSCKAMTQEDAIRFPDPLVLPSSPFYPLIDSRKKDMFFPTDQENIIYLLGTSLFRSKELAKLVQEDVSPRRKQQMEGEVKTASTRLAILYSQLFDILYRLPDDSSIWVANSEKVEDYINAEKELLLGDSEKWLRDTDFSEPVSQVLSNMNKILALAGDKKNKNAFYRELFFYPPQHVSDESLLWISPDSPAQDVTGIVSGVSQEKHTNDNNASADQRVAMTIPFTQPDYVPDQHLQVIHPLDPFQNECLGATIDSIHAGDVYRVEATLKNTSSQSNYYRLLVFSQNKEFLKTGQPSLIDNAVYTVKGVTSQRIVKMIKPTADDPNVFIGLCSRNLYQNVNRNIENLSIHRILSPELLRFTKLAVAPKKMPTITVNKINQTKYLLTVHDAASDFFLNFQEGFMTDWKIYMLPKVVEAKGSELGDAIIEKNFFTTWFIQPLDERSHMTGNGYLNTWYINRKGSYSMIIEYRPQKLFYMGVLVSMGALFCVLVSLYALSKRKK